MGLFGGGYYVSADVLLASPSAEDGDFYAVDQGTQRRQRCSPRPELCRRLALRMYFHELGQARKKRFWVYHPSRAFD